MIPSPCPGCGFDWLAVPLDEVDDRLAALCSAYQERLRSSSEEQLRRRPAPEVWSPLEYAAHVRDMALVQRERVYLALVEDRPSFARMNREERVGLARYDEETAAGLSDQVGFAFDLLRVALRDRSSEDWQRLLLYNFPEPQEHDLAWMARHTLHECVHHLHDIDAGLASTRGDGTGTGAEN